MKSLLRTVSLRRFGEHPIRTLLTIVGIALGVASFVSVQMILHTISDSFSSMIDAISGKAQLQISQENTGVEEAVFEQLRTKDDQGRYPVPEIENILPTIQTITRYQGAQVLILATDTLNEKAFADFKLTGAGGAEITDPLEFLNSTDSLLLSRDFAKRFNIELDTRIDLLTSQGVKSFVVKGYLESTNNTAVYGGNFAMMDVYAAQILYGRQGRFDTVDIYLKPGADVNAVAARVAAHLGGKYEVHRPKQRNEGVDSVLQNVRMGLNLMSLVVLVMGIFIVYNTMTTQVYQRLREIGVLRMIGVTRRGILTLFLLEAIGLGLVGSVGGIFGGYWLGRLTIMRYLGGVTSLFVPVNADHATFNLAMVLHSGLIGLIVCLAGGMWPAIRATRITPLEVVRFKPSFALGKGTSLWRWCILAAASFSFIAFGLLYPGMNTASGIKTVMVMWIIAGITVTPIFMYIFFHLLVRLTERMKNPLLRMAGENVLRDLGRTAMTVAAFMVALAVMFEIYLFMNSMKTELKTWMDDILTSDLLITSSSSFANQDSMPLSDDLTAQLAAIPGVQDVIQLRVLRLDFEGSRIMVLSVNYTDREERARFRSRETQDLQVVRDFITDRGVLVSANLVALHPSLKNAKTIRFQTPSGPVDLPILREIVDYTNEKGTVLMNRGLFIKTFRDNLVDTFHVYAKPGADLNAIRRDIDRLLGDQFNLFVLTNREFKGSILDAIDQVFALSVSLEILTLLIALIGIVNNLMANVMDHTREIGVIRSLGATRGQVALIYIMQSGLLGISGTTIGGLVGYSLAKTHLTRLSVLMSGWSMGLHYRIGLIVLIVAATTLLAVLAGVFPARRAANLPLREALKYE
ncbi:MAG: FtsX-like permease family protein [Myxococcales bacterium]|nr:FtsX-like permease family protein [Myxococcales bacterium]